MRTYHPHLPPAYHWQFFRYSPMDYVLKGGLRCCDQPHLTTRWRQPQHCVSSAEPKTLISKVATPNSQGCSSARIFELNHMLHYLCGSPSIHLSFNLAVVLPGGVFIVFTATLKINFQRLTHIVYGMDYEGILILFATYAFPVSVMI